MSDDRRDTPPRSLPQLRQGLKQALAETRPSETALRRGLKGALAAIDRHEAQCLPREKKD
jgi:hypothetical protein